MRKNRQKGIAIFIAVISVSALMLIALAISDIAYKEQIISYSGRGSKVAFNAADTGVECAMFYDLKGGPTGLSSFKTPANPSALGDLRCADTLITNFDEDVVSSSIVVTTFYFNFPASDPKSCAIVSVSKENAGGDVINTKIESRGYNNNCLGQPNNITISEGPRNLERSFRVTY